MYPLEALGGRHWQKVDGRIQYKRHLRKEMQVAPNSEKRLQGCFNVLGVFKSNDFRAKNALTIIKHHSR